MNYKVCIYHFYVDGKRYYIIYKNRPFLRFKNFLISKKENIIVKYNKFLNTVKRLKNRLFFNIRKIKKYFTSKILSLKYDIQIEGLNIAGDINFNDIGIENIPESILGLLSIEFRKIRVII